MTSLNFKIIPPYYRYINPIELNFVLQKYSTEYRYSSGKKISEIVRPL